MHDCGGGCGFVFELGLRGAASLTRAVRCIASSRAEASYILGSSPDAAARAAELKQARTLAFHRAAPAAKYDLTLKVSDLVDQEPAANPVTQVHCRPQRVM